MASRQLSVIFSTALIAIACGGSGQTTGSSNGATSNEVPGNPGAPPGSNPGALPGGPGGGGEGGGGAQGGGGSGGSGGGGGDCLSVCQGLAVQCQQDPAECALLCADPPPGLVECLQDANCETAPACLGGSGGSGGGPTGGAGGMGGSGGSPPIGGAGGLGGGGGDCTYPNCGGCTDTCLACLCAMQNDEVACSSYCSG